MERGAPGDAAQRCTGEDALHPAGQRRSTAQLRRRADRARAPVLPRRRASRTTSKIELVDTAMGKRYKVGEVVKKRHPVADRSPEGGRLVRRRRGRSCTTRRSATMALFEAYGLTQQPGARSEPAQKAHRVPACAAQKPNPERQRSLGLALRLAQATSSRSSPAGDRRGQLRRKMRDADISVTGWVVMALKSAQLAGLDGAAASAARAPCAFAIWDDRRRRPGRLPRSMRARAQTIGGPATTTSTYHPGTMSRARHAASRTFVEHDLDDPFLELAAQADREGPARRCRRTSCRSTTTTGTTRTLALNQLDGPDSPRKSRQVLGPVEQGDDRTAVLALQDKTSERDVCSRGGWLDDDRWSYAGGAALHHGDQHADARGLLPLRERVRCHRRACGRCGRGDRPLARVGCATTGSARFERTAAGLTRWLRGLRRHATRLGR